MKIPPVFNNIHIYLKYIKQTLFTIGSSTFDWPIIGWSLVVKFWTVVAEVVPVVPYYKEVILAPKAPKSALVTFDEYVTSPAIFPIEKTKSKDKKGF